ncbi:MAG: hypothetical protein ACOYKM_02480 [Caulobacterales bacterium]|jgi:hypothetical protein
MRVVIWSVVFGVCLTATTPITAQQSIWRDPAGVLAIDLGPSGAILSEAPRASVKSRLATFQLDAVSPNALCFVDADPETFFEGQPPQNWFRLRRLYHEQRANARARRPDGFPEALIAALTGPRVSADGQSYSYTGPALFNVMELSVAVLHEPAATVLRIACQVPVDAPAAVGQRAKAFLAAVRATPPASEPPAPVGLAVTAAGAPTPDANGVWTAPGGAFSLNLAAAGFVVGPVEEGTEYPTLRLNAGGQQAVECALNVGLIDNHKPSEERYALVRARLAETENPASAVVETPAGVPVFFYDRFGTPFGTWRHLWTAVWWVEGEHIPGKQAAWANLWCTSELEDAAAAQTRVDGLVNSIALPAARN